MGCWGTWVAGRLNAMQRVSQGSILSCGNSMCAVGLEYVPLARRQARWAMERAVGRT